MSPSDADDVPDDVLMPHLGGDGLAAFRRGGISLLSITVRAAKPV